MEVLYELKDLLCDKIEEVVKRNDISPTEMDAVYKAAKTIYYITTIDAMESGEYSNASYGSYGSYANSNNSYARDRRGRYSREGRSSRDGMSNGRYSERSYAGRMSREGGYSGHTKEQMMQEIAEMQQELEQMM